MKAKIGSKPVDQPWLHHSDYCYTSRQHGRDKLTATLESVVPRSE